MNLTRPVILKDNIVFISDSYKVGHHLQTPPKTKYVFSYLESRGGRYQETIFFGLQYIIKRYLLGKQVTRAKIADAKKRFTRHFGSSKVFNEAGWEHIRTAHDGRLPVVIRAVLEGTRVGVSNALLTVQNTDPEVSWLTNYLETLLSQVWYPMTVATQSYFMKQTILAALGETGTPGDADFNLHDFGFRGVSSVETAQIGGAAHLVNFKGTDTFGAIPFIDAYYGEEMAGFSIPAAEHSTITSWGATHEEDAYRNILEQFPTGIVAVVSDSYDIFRAAGDIWGTTLKSQVLERDGVLVIRPDSGNPVEVLPKVLGILGERFGTTTNAKGFKVLNPKVRLIQGDGIDYQSLGTILDALRDDGWSADNIAFGSGGGLLQKVDRDTQKCAFKCSSIGIGDDLDNLTWRDVYKDPVTDSGKRSKRGRLALLRNECGGYKTVREEEAGERNLLVPVFRNGELLLDQNFADVRKRALL